MRRWLAGIGLVAVVGLGLTGCAAAGGAAGGDDAGIEVSAGMGAEGEALAAMGFDPDDITPAEVADLQAQAPSPGPSGSAGPKDKGHGDRGKRLKARVLLRKNTLHG